MSDADRDQNPQPSIGPEGPASQVLHAGGEWPDPDNPPSEHAPGSDPARAEEIQRRRAEAAGTPKFGTETQGDQQQTGERGAGDAGPARSGAIDTGNEAEVNSGDEESITGALARDPQQGAVGSGGDARYPGGDRD